MRTIQIYDGTAIPVIGLGTWAMGGGMRPDRSQDRKALKAIRQALEMGYTHIDTAEMYASGHTEELVGQVIKDFNRDDLFITTKVMPPNLGYASVLNSLDGSLDRLGIDQVDLYLIHWPSGSVPLSETFRALNEAVQQGKVRYLGVSNFELDALQEAQRLSDTPIITNQVPYSLVTRRYANNGVLAYCQENEIILTAYSPVEEGRLRTSQALQAVAEAHQASSYQVALAWLVQQPWVITIPMSQNPDHLRLNFAAADITLTADEMAALNRIR